MKAKDRWIRKHGEDSIRTKLLEVVSTVEELRTAEIVWIERLKTYRTRRGLNLTRGGDGIWGYKFSDEVRERFRERTAEQFSKGFPQAKMSEDQAREVISRIWGGEPVSQITKDYPVSASAIQKIRSGKLWRSLPRPDGIPPKIRSGGVNGSGRSKLSDSDIANLHAEYTGERGELKRLAEKYAVTESYVCLILKGLRRKMVE